MSRRLGAPLASVFAARLCPLPGPLYTVLMGYKESPVLEARRRFGAMVHDIVDSFFAGHGDCMATVAGGPLALALPVPSAMRPTSPLLGVPGLADTVSLRLPGVTWAPESLTRAPVPIGHMRPDAAAFDVPPVACAHVRGRRIVLLEDTYVSGARSQSAAVALRHRGADSVVIVTLGRVLRPHRSSLHADFVRRQRAAPSPSDRERDAWPCCRCLQSAASTE